MKANLKILSSHYTALQIALKDLLESKPQAKEQYAAQGLSPMRFRWDALNACKIDGISGSAWISKNLYTYLDDTHIDSALRDILGMAE